MHARIRIRTGCEDWGKDDRIDVVREEGERRGDGAKLSAERKGDLKLLLGGDDSSSPRVARRSLLANSFAVVVTARNS